MNDLVELFTAWCFDPVKARFAALKDGSIISSYAKALIKEIDDKAKMADLKQVPIEAIFFGGGTPSMLSIEDIYKIGKELHKHFDLSQLREFSFEVEVKSLTREKAIALKEIGVTHPRYGVQSLSQKWRDIFDLTATLQQVKEASEIFVDLFPSPSFDILYGMNGQQEWEIIEDLDKAISLGTKNIDIYPINNVVTQTKLHKKLSELSNERTSAMRKLSMTMLIDSYMRSMGFTPHNGHGYYKIKESDQVVTTDTYSFVYHEHVYGHHYNDLLGFGVNAVSNLFGSMITNTTNRDRYIRTVMNGELEQTHTIYSTKLSYAKPLLLHLPYHGKVDKKNIVFDQLNPVLLERLEELKASGLVKETDDRFELTKEGWLWYVNIMFYLMPKQEQQNYDQMIVTKLKEPGRMIIKNEVLTLPSLFSS